MLESNAFLKASGLSTAILLKFGANIVFFHDVWSLRHLSTSGIRLERKKQKDADRRAALIQAEVRRLSLLLWLFDKDDSSSYIARRATSSSSRTEESESHRRPIDIL